MLDPYKGLLQQPFELCFKLHVSRWSCNSMRCADSRSVLMSMQGLSYALKDHKGFTADVHHKRLDNKAKDQWADPLPADDLTTDGQTASPLGGQPMQYIALKPHYL